MTIAPDRIISKYHARQPLFRAIYSLVFLIVLATSILWIVYQLQYPDVYANTHRTRYGILITLGVITTIYVASKVFDDGSVALDILFHDDSALVLRGGTIVSTNSSKISIDVADIESISLEPFQRTFGRPARLRVTTRSGLVRYIRCDILDRSGLELMREISELAHLPVPVGADSA